jgi:hypothetical protein
VSAASDTVRERLKALTTGFSVVSIVSAVFYADSVPANVGVER